MTECDASEESSIARCEFRPGGYEMERPTCGDGLRDIAHVLVARLVSQIRRNGHVSSRNVGGDCHADADGELVLEHAQTLIGVSLLQVDGLRPDDFSDGDARRSVNLEGDRN